MDRDIEPTSPKLKNIPSDLLLASDLGRTKWPEPTAPVWSLEIAAAQRDLAEAGLRVPDIDHMANELATGARLISPVSIVPRTAYGRQLARVLGGALLVGMAGWLGTQVHGDAHDPMQRAIGWISWTITLLGTLAVIVMCLSFLFGGEVPLKDPRPADSRRRRALEILLSHVTSVELPKKSKDLIERAVRAEKQIKDSEVWSTNFFDSHRVRIALSQEVGEITGRLRQLASISGPVVKMRDPASHVVKSTAERVAALEDYRDQVLECDRDLKRLAVAETAEYNADRLTELLASTGADRSQIDNLGTLAGEARAAAEAIRETLQVMSGTVAALMPTSKS